MFFKKLEAIMCAHEIRPETEVSLFNQLESLQAANASLDRNDLIHFGEELSSPFFKLIKTVFGGMEWVSKALDNRFYDRAVTVIKQHNWEVVNDTFKIKNGSENPVLEKLVPSNIVLLPKTPQFQAIQKFYDDETLKAEVNNMKNLDSKDRLKASQDHWLEAFSPNLKNDLETLLEGNTSSIHQLNRLMKDQKLSQFTFGNLVKDVIGETPLKEITKDQMQSVTNVIKFFNEHQFLLEKLPGENFAQVYELLESTGKPEDKMAFLEFFKGKEIIKSLDIKTTIQETQKEFKAFQYEKLKNEAFAGLLQDYPTISKENADELRLLYDDRLDKTKNDPNTVIKNLKDQIGKNGLEDTLNSLRLKKEITDIEVFNDLDRVGDEISNAFDKAGDQISDAFKKWTASLKNDSPSDILVKNQKADFKAWLKNEKIPEKDATRLYEFYDRLVDKNVYSPKIIGEALKMHLQGKDLKKTMDDLFPRTSTDWFGIIEADPLDVFYKSDGKKALLEACFKLEAREIVKQAMIGQNVDQQTMEQFADQFSSIFENSNQLIKKEALLGSAKLMAFAAILATKYPRDIVIKEFQAKQANFYNYDLEDIDSNLDPLILSRIEENVRANAEKELFKTGAKKDDVASLARRNPTLLIGTVAANFIEKLFSDDSKVDKAIIQQSINAFSPLLNPIILNSKALDNDLIINGTANMLIKTKQETIGKVLELPKAIIKDQIVFDESGKGDFFYTMVQTIVDANEIFRTAKENKTDLKTLKLKPIQKWLLFSLQDLSNGMPFVETINSIVPSAIVKTGIVAEYFAGKVAASLTASLLEDNYDLTYEEKEKMAEGASALAKTILPIIPKLKEKHNVERYTAFIKDLNSLVHSEKPITGEEVAEKIKGIVDHFLDKEIDQYNTPIYAAIQSIPTLLGR